MIYTINGYTADDQSQDFQSILASAYKMKHRPVCICKAQGAEMYIAKIDQTYYVKRMPNTGSNHSFTCASFEPPAELSGLGQVLGSAIVEDKNDGITKLKFAFSLSKTGKREALEINEDALTDSGSVVTDNNKLTLKSTLHFLWEEAGLNKWKNEWSGKRTWFYIRKSLLQAAHNKSVKSSGLSDLLYIPETFFLDKKEEIAKRRKVDTFKAVERGLGTKNLMLVIGEVKETATTRYGFKIVLKHLPDFHLMLNEDIHKRLIKRYRSELDFFYDLEGSAHLMLIGTFSIGISGSANLDSAALMVVDENWIPFDTASEKFILNELNEQKRSYIKGLRYNMSPKLPLASFVLTDTGVKATAMYLINDDEDTVFSSRLDELIKGSSFESWCWDINSEDFKELPARANISNG